MNVQIISNRMVIFNINVSYNWRRQCVNINAVAKLKNEPHSIFTQAKVLCHLKLHQNNYKLRKLGVTCSITHIEQC